MHKVSIIVTNYNTEKYIDNCLNSIFNSNYKNIEVIVIDDCSTDNSLEIISKYPVKLITNKTNLGAGKSRNIGVHNASGDFIMFVDSDDTISSDLISELSKSIDDKVDIVLGRISLNRFPNSKYENRCAKDLKDKIEICKDHHLCFMGALIRKTLFDKVEYCNRRIIEDTPTLYKLLNYSNELVESTDKGIYNASVRPDSITGSLSTYEHCIYSLLTFIDLILFFSEHNNKSLVSEFISRFRIFITHLQHIKDNSSEINPLKKEYDFIINFNNKLLKNV